MKMKLKSLVIAWVAGAMNWVDDHVITSKFEISWQDHLRWWIQAQLSKIFSWAWNGSNEELAAVHNGEIPFEYMSPRQRAEFDRISTTHHLSTENSELITANGVC